MMRELGVSVNTIYNVTSELAGMGVPLAIHPNRKILIPHTSSPHTSPLILLLIPHTSHQKLHRRLSHDSSLSPEQTEALLKILSRPVSLVRRN